MSQPITDQLHELVRGIDRGVPQEVTMARLLGLLAGVLEGDSERIVALREQMRAQQERGDVRLAELQRQIDRLKRVHGA